VVTVTSEEILANLAQLLGPAGRSRLCLTPLVVISERLRQAASALGVVQVICADGASDTALLAAFHGLAGERLP
jgi:uroporphyrinogen-III synthase